MYFGGKNFNMRIRQRSLNFEEKELKEAVDISHDYGKKAYITVNNLINSEELKSLLNYLEFLKEIKCDAIIIQDLGILKYALSFGIPIHASVMMNVHNEETIRRLSELGVTRSVIAREISLAEIKTLSHISNMELEYFVHGNMCISYGGQCLYSGIIYGESSNRGRCFTPCRWGFQLYENPKELYYPLAVKDMYMYENLPEMIDAGITSFKIEGRMGSFEYLSTIVNAYGDSIDRYIEDPIAFNRQLDAKALFEQRKRDFSTTYAFGKPGKKNINTYFANTKKASVIEEKSIDLEKVKKLKLFFANKKAPNIQSSKLNFSVRVNNMEQAKVAIYQKVSRIILSGDTLLPNRPFSKFDILELCKNKGDTEIVVGLPHVMKDIDFSEYAQLLSYVGEKIDGIFCTNLGAVSYFKDYKRFGDIPLNIYNYQTVCFYLKEGLKDFMVSPECKPRELISIINECQCPLGIVVYGSPTVMYLEHDLYGDTKYVGNKLSLIDEIGFAHPIYKDCHERNHILLYKKICLLPILKELYNAGLTYGLIEACDMCAEELISIIMLYQEAAEDLDRCDELFAKLNYKNLSLGSFEY